MYLNIHCINLNRLHSTSGNFWHHFRSVDAYKSKNMRRLYSSILVFALFLVATATTAAGQDSDDIIGDVNEALKSSSSKELAPLLHDRVEIKLDAERKEYSANQAELVLKQFFQKHPADHTEFIHQGNSPGGIVYAIGNYASGNNSYRLVIRARKYKDDYKVYRLEFTKE